MDFEKFTVVGLRPNCVAAISDESLLANIAFYSALKRLCGHRFANWMQSVWSHEYERRQSGGAIEMCSFEMPMMQPWELAKIRSWVTVKTYSCDEEAKLYDEILSAVDVQTRYHLEQYTKLLETR